MTSSQIYAATRGVSGQAVSGPIYAGATGTPNARIFDDLQMRLRKLTDDLHHVAWCVNEAADRVIGLTTSPKVNPIASPEVSEVHLMEQLNRLENQYKNLVEALSRLDMIDR